MRTQQHPGIPWFSGFSLRAKLIIIFIILSVIPLVILGLTSFSKSFSAIQSISVDSFSQVADQLNKSINLLFRDSEKFLKIGSSDASIRFLKPQISEDEKYASAMEIIAQFKMYRDIFDFDEYLKGIYIIGLNGNNISEKRGVYRLARPLESIATVQSILADHQTIYIHPNKEVEYSDQTRIDEVISIGKVIRKPVTREVLGVIIVDLDPEAVYNLCKDLTIGPYGEYYIVENQNSIIYPPGFVFRGTEISPEYIREIATNERGHFISRHKGNNEFIVFNTLERTSWKIIGRVEQKTLMASAIVIKNVTLVVLLLCISFSILIYFFISDKLTLPLRDLKQKMREAERGNLEVVALSRNRDEIADLCHSFNVMIAKIKDLIAITISEQEELKKYELRTLQAQINPHFLYNSLDAIVWMSEAGNKKEVVKITKTLSNFFRISLSKGEDWILLKDEIEHVRSYLTIQKMRYRDLMDYQIDLPEHLLDYRILKIILQPLIENALYHGIKSRRTGGMIRVWGEVLDEHKIALRVSDTGIGMTEERLREVQAALGNHELNIQSEGGFGLKNVNQRLRLYYGKEYGLILENRSEGGTLASVVIPKRR